jgi:hypothetical protein
MYNTHKRCMDSLHAAAVCVARAASPLGAQPSRLRAQQGGVAKLINRRVRLGFLDIFSLAHCDNNLTCSRVDVSPTEVLCTLRWLILTARGLDSGLQSYELSLMLMDILYLMRTCRYGFVLRLLVWTRLTRRRLLARLLSRRLRLCLWPRHMFRFLRRRKRRNRGRNTLKSRRPLPPRRFKSYLHLYLYIHTSCQEACICTCVP